MIEDNILFEHKIDFFDIKKIFFAISIMVVSCAIVLFYLFRQGISDIVFFILLVIFFFLIISNILFFHFLTKTKIILSDDRIYFIVYFFKTSRIYEMKYIDIERYNVSKFDEFHVFSKDKKGHFNCYFSKKISQKIIKILDEKIKGTNLF